MGKLGVAIAMVLESVQPVVLYTPFNVGFPNAPLIVIRLGQKFALVLGPLSAVVIVVIPFETVIPVRVPQTVFHCGKANDWAIRR